jgi:hypothetical protein
MARAVIGTIVTIGRQAKANTLFMLLRGEWVPAFDTWPVLRATLENAWVITEVLSRVVICH